MANRDPRFHTYLWLARLALVLAVVLVGARSFGFESVDFDDPRMFFIHPHLRPLNWENIRWMFTDASYNNRFYSPLLWLFYSIAGHCFGFAAQPQHVVNVLLHAAVALLLFEVLRTLIAFRANESGFAASRVQTLGAACIGAMFWALHPLRVEVTGWIAARVHLHAAIFALLACWAYLILRRNAETTPWKHPLYWIAVALYCVSVLSFPTAVTLPLALGLMDFYLLRTHVTLKTQQRITRIASELVPFVLVAAAPVAISFLSNVDAIEKGQTAAGNPLPPVEHFMAICYVFWRYVWATLLPIGLAPMYTQLLNVRAGAPLFIISSLMVVGISITTFLLRRRWVGLWCAWLCYVALMLPFIGLHGRPKYASDRYGYVSTMVIAVLVALLIMQIGSRYSARIRWIAKLAITGILVLLGAVSIRQIGIWRDSPTLFYVLIDKLGDSPVASTPMVHLASYLVDQNQSDQASQWLGRARKVNPDDPNIALAELKIIERRCERAEQSKDQSIEGCYVDMIEFCVANDPAVHRDVFAGVLANALAKLSELAPRPADQPRTMRALLQGSVRAAKMLEQGGNIPAAAAWYTRAYDLGRSASANVLDQHTLDFYATACIKLAHLDDAASALEKLIAQSTDSAGPMIRLAYVRLAQNRRADADNMMHQVAERWPAMKPEVEKIRQSWPAASATMPR